MAKFMVVTGRITDNPARTRAIKRARFFRVIEAEYTGVTTSSHTNLETRILGVVPILPTARHTSRRRQIHPFSSIRSTPAATDYCSRGTIQILR